MKLDSAKLQLQKEKISNLTNEEMTWIVGGSIYPGKTYPCPSNTICWTSNGCHISCGSVVVQ